PLADIFDTVGLVARSVDDCLLADAVLRGAPEQELTPVSSLTLGVARRLVDRAQPEVAAHCTRALETLSDLGVRLVDVELPVRGIQLSSIYAAELASAWANEVE